MHQPQEGTVSQLATSSRGAGAVGGGGGSSHLISPYRCGLLFTQAAQQGEFREYLEQMEVAQKPLPQTDRSKSKYCA